MRQVFLKLQQIFSLCLLLVVLGGLPAIATGVYDLPVLSAGSSTWVIDKADAISIATQNNLESTLQKLAQKTGNEVRMVAIRRLDFDQTIDTFADKLFISWYPTPEEQANQTILVLDSLTNTLAIRTGENIKKIMPDAIAESVAQETAGIPIRDGNKYNQAFVDASKRLTAVLSGKPDPGAPVVADKINTEGTFTKAEDTDAGSATVWVIVALVVATVIPMVTYFWYVGFPGN